MASPTEAEIRTQINALVWATHQANLWLNGNAENLGGHYDDFVAAMEGDFVSAALAGLDEFRAQAADLVSPTRVRRFLDALIREYGKALGFPETDPLAILDRMFVQFAETTPTPVTVQERDVTFGTPSNDGGNTGNGTLHRLTVDRYGYDTEACTMEAKEFKCIRDRSGGATVHLEEFEIRGADVPRDLIAGVVSRNRVGRINAIGADTSRSWLQNPSFNEYTSSTGSSPYDPTAIAGWTVAGAIGDLQIVTTDYYRAASHEGDSPACLRFEANEKITQAFTVVNGELKAGVPYFFQIAFKRENSCDGTLTLRVGSNSAAVTFSAESGWNTLVCTLDENLFPRNFNETTLDVEIELSGNSTGEALVDDLVFGPMTLWDGTWWALVGGATPYLLEDKITATDALTGSEAILNYWLWRIYGKVLPMSGTPVWAEPS